MEGYKEVEANKVTKRKWKYFLRQLMVSSGVWTLFFMIGQFLGAPTVIIPQIRRAANSTEVLGDEMASWLSSVFGYAAIPWVFVLPISIRLCGLRLPYIACCIDLLVSYAILYYSTTPLQILISEIVYGIAQASTLTIGILIVNEYSSPENRGVFLTIKCAVLFTGIWSSNAIGTFFHWKYIAFSGFLCVAYALVTSFLWPESPQWLASKGKLEESKAAFYWLHGKDDESEKRLQELFLSQARKSRLNKDWSTFSDVIRTIRYREFYVPLFLLLLMVSQYHFSGKFVCAIYAIDIIKRITANETTAYVGMLIIDGITVAGMYFGCYLTKILKRRTLYFASSFTGIAFLFIIALYLYLVKLSVIAENAIVSIVLLMCYSLAMACGPMIMCSSIYAEIIPIRFKSVIVTIAALFFYFYLTSMLKIAPFLFKKLGLHGSFLLYGVAASVCTVILYKYLPETKDKTLQEIEEHFKDKLSSEEDQRKPMYK